MTGRRSPKQLENRSAELAMRAEVADRSGGFCEMERRVDATAGETHLRGYRIERDENGGAWSRCGMPASDGAHVERRWRCGMLPTDDGPALKYHPFVVIAGCRRCHTEYDSRLCRDRVRVSPAFMASAKALIDHTLQAAEARGEAAIWPWARPE